MNLDLSKRMAAAELLAQKLEEAKIQLALLTDKTKSVCPVRGTGVMEGFPSCPICHTRVMWNSGYRFTFCSSCGHHLDWTGYL
jgi:hypothetical protein